MDQGLRITVGNDMYYDKAQPRSPRDNPRNRLGARMEGNRFDERMDDPYRRRSPPRVEDRRSWGSDGAYGRHPSDRPPDQYVPPASNRYEFDRGHHSHWDEQKTTYDPDLHQNYPPQRSPSSMNRGRSPYRRRTPSPYSSYANVRRHSRSRSRSPYRKRSRSRSRSRGRLAMGDDLLSSMYSGALDSIPRESDLHSKGALDKLRESYDKKEPEYFKERINSKKGVAEEEEAYLYGDDGGAPRYQKETKKRDYFSEAVKVPEPPPAAPVITKPAKKEAVTPGGFDTNALKNVLKAIGFDFELSAQSLQKAAIGKDASKTAPPPPKPEPTKPKTEPQPVAPSTVPLPQQQSEAVYAHPFQQALQAGQYLQPNLLQNQDPAFLFNQAAALQYQPNMAIPGTVAPQLIYQPLSYVQPGTVPVTVPDRPNLKVIPTVSMDEKTKKATIKSAKTLAEEKKARKKRLDYLEVELKSLKKKQAELTRKKKKQLNSTDQEQMRENSMLQAGVVKQIKEIREAAEKAAGIRSESSGSESEGSSSSSSSDEGEVRYIDTGNHFCRDCNFTTGTVSEYFTHLHTKRHRKIMDPDYKPWYKKIEFKVKEGGPTSPLKGAQFLLPVSGFYCKLCRTYSGDSTSASEHCKTRAHNLNYVKFCKKNPDYAKQQKSADIQNVADRLKKLKEGQKIQTEKKNRNVYLKPSHEMEDVPRKSKSDVNEEKYYKNEAKDKYFDEDKKFYKYDQKEKYFNDRKVKDSHYYPDNGYKRRDVAPEPSKPDEKWSHDKYFDQEQPPSSRSSSRMREHSPNRPKDPRLKDIKDENHKKGFVKPEESYKGQSSGGYQRRRSLSPFGRPGFHHDDRGGRFYKAPNKRRFEVPSSKMREEKKNAKQRKARWSPGYDELEERRENNESSFKEGKMAKAPASSFGKFTWKKNEKGKTKKEGSEPATESNDNKNNEKFSLKIETKTSGGTTRNLRSRSGFGTFAPHTKVVTSQKEAPLPAKPVPKDGKPKVMPRQPAISAMEHQKSWNKPNLAKKPIHTQGVPPQHVKSIFPAAKQVVEQKKDFEPPPPGTEDIFEADEGSISDASGISMEIGSDNEV